MKLGNCKHCSEEFIKTRKDKVYCCQSCVTMACYQRNNYKYVSGRYVKEGASNQNEQVSKSSDKKNNKTEKKLNRLEKKFDELKQLIEQGQKATSGLLTATLGPILARVGEYAGKKLIWPGSLPATKDDINGLKKQNDEISEQNRRLLEHHEKKTTFL